MNSRCEFIYLFFFFFVFFGFYKKLRILSKFLLFLSFSINILIELVCGGCCGEQDSF